MTRTEILPDNGTMTKGEETLRESEEKYRDLANLLPQVVFETDEKGILTFVNRELYGEIECNKGSGRQPG